MENKYTFVLLVMVLTFFSSCFNETSEDNSESPVIITLIGDVDVTITQKNEYVELGATAYDPVEGEIDVAIYGYVNIHKVGSYTITYLAINDDGDSKEIYRTVTVVDDMLPDEFITTWKTDNNGFSEDNEIMIETTSFSGYDYTVDWGDGKVQSNITASVTHTYDAPGTYTVSISGNFPQIYFNGETKKDPLDPTKTLLLSDNNKILSVENWGSNSWMSMNKAFYRCSNLVINASDAPDLYLVNNMNNMFAGATNVNQNINHWNTSNIVYMEGVFGGAENFNQDISGWDVSNVTTMKNMFLGADNFNQDVGNWDVSKVTNMEGMFFSAENFNQDLSEWDVSSVKTMESMFWVAPKFNGNISNWNVSSVTNMTRMFANTDEFNQDLNNWDVSNVRSMQSMFESAASFNLDIGDWDVSSVESMSGMFQSSIFNQDISRWDVSSVNNMFKMFFYRSAFNQDISEWDVSNVITMESMFGIDFDQDISDWDFSSIASMKNMFSQSKLSTDNYDALLISLSNQMPPHGIDFHAGSSTYTPDSPAQIARTTLIEVYGWNITDFENLFESF